MTNWVVIQGRKQDFKYQLAFDNTQVILFLIYLKNMLT